MKKLIATIACVALPVCGILHASEPPEILDRPAAAYADFLKDSVAPYREWREFRPYTTDEYVNGMSKRMSPKAITKRDREVADNGYALAANNLGTRYAEGAGVEKDPVEAAKWFLKAAEQGELRAQFNLGMLYSSNEDIKDSAKAAEWYRKAAESGDAWSQFNLGLMYAHGEGVPQNSAEAIEWYRKAAEQRASHAQCILGQIYSQGQSVPQDLVEAAGWYRKAAELGNTGAQWALALSYARGDGVARDPVEAAKWYLIVAEKRDKYAQYNLAELYRRGDGVEQDRAEAIRWYKRAAYQCLPEAEKRLAAMGVTD